MMAFLGRAPRKLLIMGGHFIMQLVTLGKDTGEQYLSLRCEGADTISFK